MPDVGYIIQSDDIFILKKHWSLTKHHLAKQIDKHKMNVAAKPK